MKVILQHSVQKLGQAGDIVEAKPGYFRNFLQPRGLAVVASAGSLKKREEDLEALRRKAEQLHKAAVELSEKISNIGTIKVAARVGEGGKLYGKITHKEIAALIEKEVGAPIDKRLVKTNEDVAALGTFTVHVKLAPEVQGEVNLEVVMETAAG
ncbi:MAG: 50S ribosomal protein L9 [Candidatus Melainabacteria bacterium]|jgi:large subunit ribosomal protein L9|uniref:Large ribosomal subunit protein bL9 n=1 Tax=Candidatus Obscuribacter phosphatis TaxID=1906157 RepID=A0A8J7PNQ9_9BACT|nr:50S ribosomal protein L9 [Candidatus Obscuribacter phosphatis]MBX9938418.1 50S ribosomal protein L9 [Candidatus Obscuribacterales bacterium]MCA0315971.1 50S ribosomal protein L9 [Candidatus Melainabacteria bacterium]